MLSRATRVHLARFSWDMAKEIPVKRIVMAVALFAAFGAVPVGTLANVAHASKSNHDEEATRKREADRAKAAAKAAAKQSAKPTKKK